MKLVKVENGIKLVVSKGAKGDSIEWKGEWSPTVVYDTIHVVSRGGASWISKQSANIGHDPLTDDGIWWDCMVADSLAEGYRNEALTYRNEAEDFAESATSSAESATTSASNAAESEENAAMSAANAATSETNAAISAQNAATSEVNAKASEINAATSEANALESANSAEVYKNEAQYWANIAQDVVFTAEVLQRLETMGGILI